MPILFGFLIPVLILIENSLNYFHLENFNHLVTVAQNSFFISFTTATIIILLSIILTVSIKYQNFKGFNFLSTMAGIGYAFPGIIIALGTLFFISFIEKFVNLSLEIFSIDLNLILIGSYFLLIFAYISRFNAVSFGAINSGINRLPPNLLEASRSLGNPFWYSFTKVILRLLRPSILTAFILAFVDIINLSLKLGGTIAGEHGIGTLKKDFIKYELDEIQLKKMKEIKNLFDPNFILNPGKKF